MLILRIYLTVTYFIVIIVLKIRIFKNIIAFRRSFMNEVGIIKEFDKLGRIVIPKELRERYGLTVTVEIVATKDGILLKNSEYVLVEKKKKW